MWRQPSTKKEKELQLQKDDLEFLLNGIRHAVLFSEALVKEGSDSEIAAGHQQVVTRMVTLTGEREKAHFGQETDSGLEFIENEEVLEVLNTAIKELGAGFSWTRKETRPWVKCWGRQGKVLLLR